MEQPFEPISQAVKAQTLCSILNVLFADSEVVDAVQDTPPTEAEPDLPDHDFDESEQSWRANKTPMDADGCFSYLEQSMLVVCRTLLLSCQALALLRLSLFVYSTALHWCCVHVTLNSAALLVL